MAYEFLQDRLEKLEEHRGEGAGEVDEQRRFNDDLLNEYGLLLKARQAWELAGEIKDVATTLSASKSITGVVNCKECEGLWKNCAQLRQAVRILAKWDELAQLRDEVDPIIASLKERFERECATDHAPKPPTTLKEPDRSSQSCLKATLPKFSGNVLEWCDFWRTFKPLLDRETSLSDVEKIAHLLASMSGEQALREAKIAAGAHEKYEDVVARLKSRYDQPRTVYRSHVRQLCKTKTVQYTRSGLLDALAHVDVRSTTTRRIDLGTVPASFHGDAFLRGVLGSVE